MIETVSPQLTYPWDGPCRANVSTNPLENLLPPYILQPRVQIPHLLHNLADLALIRALDGARLPNRHI